MERMKNVYKVTVKTENGGICEKFILRIVQTMPREKCV